MASPGWISSVAHLHSQFFFYRKIFFLLRCQAVKKFFLFTKTTRCCAFIIDLYFIISNSYMIFFKNRLPLFFLAYILHFFGVRIGPNPVRTP